MPKLKITVISYIDVEDLDDYEAKTIQEAAVKCAEWIANGDMALFDMTEEVDSYTVEGIE